MAAQMNVTKYYKGLEEIRPHVEKWKAITREKKGSGSSLGTKSTAITAQNIMNRTGEPQQPIRPAQPTPQPTLGEIGNVSTITGQTPAANLSAVIEKCESS